MTTTVQMPRATRAAELRPQSFNAEANTIDVVWTTGATVRQYDWATGEPYQEILELAPRNVRLGRLNSGAPLLNTHSRAELADVIGSVVPGSARLESGQGVATVQLSRAPGDADIVQKIRDGVIRNISAGYIRHRIEKTEAERGTIAVWRVTDWEPIEISAVPIPADPGAQTRSANNQTFPCVVQRAQRQAGKPSLAEAARRRMLAREEASGLADAARRRMAMRARAAGIPIDQDA